MKIVLVALNGLLRSKPFSINREKATQKVYFAHFHKTNIFFYDALENETYPEVKKLGFEWSGKIFYDKKKKERIYEYELTEI